MFKWMTFAIAAAVVLSGFARLEANAPKDPAKNAEKRFARMDKDGDKKLTLEEFLGKKKDEMKEKATKRFSKLDKDSDEFLSWEEFQAGQKKKKN